MALTPNSPRKRLEYALRSEKNRTVVLATVEAAIDLMGLEADAKVDEAHTRLVGRHAQGRDMQPALDQLYPLLPANHPMEWLIPWMHRELASLRKKGDATEADWTEAVDVLKRRGPAIAQWAKETRTDIGRVNLAQALDAIATYEFKESLVTEGEIVYEFSDGWTIQGLKGDPQLKAEGRAMQHCVGSYCGPVAHGESKIFSLRDPAGNPHVTIEWRLDEDRFHRHVGEPSYVRKVLKGTYAQFFDEKEDVYIGVFGQRRKPLSWLGEVVQVYGKQNAPPAKKYEPYVQEFIREKLGGDEVGLFLAGVPAQEINWRGVRMEPLNGVGGLDFREVDLRAADFAEGAFAFDGWSLDGANLSGRNLKMALFTSVAARGAVFNDADLGGAVFARTDLENASFRGAHLDGVEFERSTLGSADVSGADLTGVIAVDEDGRFETDAAKQWLKTNQSVISDDETIWPDGMKVSARRRHA